MNDRIQELELDGVIDFTRQRDWFDPSKSTDELSIIGTGGVGSMFAILASKLGINKINLFDGDIVDTHNLPNQFFPIQDVGQTKVDSLAATIGSYSVSDVTAYSELVDTTTKLSGVVVSGVDSMEARAKIADAVRASRFRVKHYFDARIGGENITIYSVNPKDINAWENYELTLYNDGAANPDPCTRRSVIDVMGHVASDILTLVRRNLAGEEVPDVFWHNVGKNEIFTCPYDVMFGEIND